MRGRWSLAIIGVILIVAGGLLAWLTQTSGGIRIEDVRFKGANGNTMSALLYVPPNATAQTPAPGILAVHGYINSRETQDGFAIEFARRGYVVLALEPDRPRLQRSAGLCQWLWRAGRSGPSAQPRHRRQGQYRP